MTPPMSVLALRRAIDAAAARRSLAPGRLHYTVASTVAGGGSGGENPQ